MSARFAAFLAILAAFVWIPAPAQEAAKSETLPASLDVARLLAGPDRSDIKCEVELSPPKLTFQQRNLVRLRAVLDPSDEERRNRQDIFFVLKIADANGDWFPGETHNEFRLEPGFNTDSAIAYSTGFYLKAGKYTAALLVYDTASGKTDVIRKHLEVKAPKNDPLPQLDEHVPTLEFISDIPNETPPVRAEARWYRPSRPAFQPTYHAEDLWPPGHGVENLPVGNTRPLQVDIVLNLAAPVDSYLTRATTESQARLATGIMMQAGAILSHLGVDPGCVRVGAVDLSRLEVVFDPLDARRIDWNKLAKEAEDRNNNTISVRALSHRTDTADFLKTELEKIADGRPACGDGGGVAHAIMFVSQDFSFPSGTHNSKFVADPKPGLGYYQIRISRYGSGDSLGHFFSGVKARKFEADSPEQFRRALTELISALGGGGGDEK